MDITVGSIFELKLSIANMPINIRNRRDAIKFLFRRVNSKPLLMNTLRGFIESKNEDLKTISDILEIINKYYWNQLHKRETEKQERFDEKLKRMSIFNRSKPLDLVDINVLSRIEDEDDSSQNDNVLGYPIVEQSDMYRYIFLPIDEAGSLSTMDLVNVLVEYISVLKRNDIPVHNFIQKLLIELLVKSNNYSLLHQYVQFKVISDSKLTALQMLYISEKYKPAYQISLDMLRRLKEFDMLCEIMISRNEIPQALELMNMHYEEYVFKIPPSLIFEKVVSTSDSMLFYNTFEILQKINFKYKKSPYFLAEEKCREYEELFQKQFIKQ